MSAFGTAFRGFTRAGVAARRCGAAARCGARPVARAPPLRTAAARSFATDEDAPVVTGGDIGGGEALADVPGTVHGGRRLAIVFTCSVCETRSAKKFSADSYERGVVVVTCPGCQNNHLIADNLGFFEDDRWDVEKLAAARGESVRRFDDDNLLGDLSSDELHALARGAPPSKGA